MNFAVILSMLISLTVSILFSQTVHGSDGLTIYVFLKYSPLQVKDPSNIGNILMTWHSLQSEDHGTKTLDLESLPAVTTIDNFDVPVNSAFVICLNSEKRDDGTCEQGINNPINEPETIYIDVP